MGKLKRALSAKGLLNKQFNTVKFRGPFSELIGNDVEMNGSWIIYGASGNGKTRFTLQLAKFLAHYDSIYYNSLEEGCGKTLQRAIQAEEIAPTTPIFFLEKESYKEIVDRLAKQRAPGIIIIDSIQYFSISKEEFKTLKEAFPKKLFIFISHASETNKPKGSVAEFVQYDSHVKIMIQGFKAIAQSRFGGTGDYIIWEEGAERFYGQITQ